MAKYHFTNKAVEDLSNIWAYTFKTWSERQADFYYNMLIDICRDIAENPALGRNYENIADGLYGIIAGKHIIFYQQTSEGIEIIRILHGSMNLKNRIQK